MLLGPNGHPLTGEFKKAAPPKLGPAFGDWAGRDTIFNQLPGGAVLQFDLNQLTLADYRAMRDHPQINASLCVLAFMMHQLDWKIEAEKPEIASMIEENLRETWTRMVRALSQAYWSGYSPVVLEYENDVQNRRIVINKFKDLVPEESEVNWKKVKGYAPPGETPPTFKQYDGIKHRRTFGSIMGTNGSTSGRVIPVENTLWYPLLMENGDYYGRKLLRPAFPSWYFSILIHLFANRYYERFGEPVPVGRAPFDDEIETGDENEPTVSGKTAMETILRNLRNRSVVVLPSSRTPIGAGNHSEYDYDLEYLESQMRGADFERYMQRLDEEMSLGIFTPVLLFRTADVGSYNLGVSHMQIFLWMLNALAGDMKEYIDKYVVTRLRDFNFGPNAGKVEWKYRKMGKENVETIRAVIAALISKDKATVDLDELGTMMGLTVKEVRQIADPNADPNADPDDDREVRDKPGSRGKPRGVGQPRATGRQISNRIKSQVDKAWREGKFGTEFTPSLGYRRRFEESLRAEGFTDDKVMKVTDEFYTRVGDWMSEAISLGDKEYAGPADFMSMFDRVLDGEIERIATS